MELKHKVGGWIFDNRSNRMSKITEIRQLSHDDQEWVNHGAPSVAMYCLIFGHVFTHYLTVDELNDLYPYVGKNVNEGIVKALYGSRHVDW